MLVGAPEDLPAIAGRLPWRDKASPGKAPLHIILPETFVVSGQCSFFWETSDEVTLGRGIISFLLVQEVFNVGKKSRITCGPDGSIGEATFDKYGTEARIERAVTPKRRNSMARVPYVEKGILVTPERTTALRSSSGVTGTKCRGLSIVRRWRPRCFVAATS
jgi:hypothetical protein